MKSFFKQIITIFILTSILMLVLFSFDMMMHGPDGRMDGDCPFSEMNQSTCPQDIVAIAIHHLSSYKAFFNVPIGTSLVALIISLLLTLVAISIIFIRLPLIGPPALVGILYDSPPTNSYSRKIIAWLSLFENSPTHF